MFMNDEHPVVYIRLFFTDLDLLDSSYKLTHIVKVNTHHEFSGKSLLCHGLKCVTEGHRVEKNAVRGQRNYIEYRYVFFSMI